MEKPALLCPARKASAKRGEIFGQNSLLALGPSLTLIILPASRLQVQHWSVAANVHICCRGQSQKRLRASLLVRAPNLAALSSRTLAELMASASMRFSSSSSGSQVRQLPCCGTTKGTSLCMHFLALIWHTQVLSVCVQNKRQLLLSAVS